MSENRIELLQKRVSTHRILAIVIPVIIMFIAIIMTYMSGKQITVQARNRQDVIASNQSQAETSQFNQFVTREQVSLEKIDYALPNESMLVGVVQDIEGMIRSFDPTASLSFASSTPVRAGADLTIPITIRIKLPTADIPIFVKRIQSLPYIIQLLTIDSQINNNVADATFGFRLYVQEPFSGI